MKVKKGGRNEDNFFWWVEEVTGSRYLVESDDVKISLIAGFFKASMILPSAIGMISGGSKNYRRDHINARAYRSHGLYTRHSLKKVLRARSIARKLPTHSVRNHVN